MILRLQGLTCFSMGMTRSLVSQEHKESKPVCFLARTTQEEQVGFFLVTLSTNVIPVFTRS